jgi:hypothetical protein
MGSREQQSECRWDPGSSMLGAGGTLGAADGEPPEPSGEKLYMLWGYGHEKLKYQQSEKVDRGGIPIYVLFLSQYFF